MAPNRLFQELVAAVFMLAFPSCDLRVRISAVELSRRTGPTFLSVSSSDLRRDPTVADVFVGLVETIDESYRKNHQGARKEDPGFRNESAQSRDAPAVDEARLDRGRVHSTRARRLGDSGSRRREGIGGARHAVGEHRHSRVIASAISLTVPFPLIDITRVDDAVVAINRR